MRLDISKKTKVICTIGPASETPEMVLRLYEEGMNVMRLNFSHGTHEQQRKKLLIARSFEEKYGILLPVALDTKGPEIRTGMMEGGKVDVPEGHEMRISMEPCLGNSERFSCSYKGLYDDVNVGDYVLVDDGNLQLDIIGKDEERRELLVRAHNAHYLKDQKGMNAPCSRLSMPFISEQDEKDLAFGCEHHVDAIFASFVRRPEDVADMRAILAKYGDPNIPIFAKIENPEAVEKIEQIVDCCDGIMVARGDLGVEVPPEEVPVIQKRIIDLCRKAPTSRPPSPRAATASCSPPSPPPAPIRSRPCRCRPRSPRPWRSTSITRSSPASPTRPASIPTTMPSPTPWPTPPY